jgi:hypothetical protein
VAGLKAEELTQFSSTPPLSVVVAVRLFAVGEAGTGTGAVIGAGADTNVPSETSTVSIKYALSSCSSAVT